MLAIIAARAGSKGLKNKNILKLNGKPLIAYSIQHALRSKFITKVIVSTDSPKIAKIAKKYGAEVPFLRPKKLAQDNSSINKAFEHAILFLEKKGFCYENFISLGGSCPIRTKQDIDNAVKLYFTKKAQTLISVKENDKPIEWYFKKTKGERLIKFQKKQMQNRQKHEKLLIPNGSIYVFNTKKLLKNIKLNKDYSNNRTFYYLMPEERSVDIDNLNDFCFADYLLRKK